MKPKHNVAPIYFIFMKTLKGDVNLIPLFDECAFIMTSVIRRAISSNYTERMTRFFISNPAAGPWRTNFHDPVAPGIYWDSQFVKEVRTLNFVGTWDWITNSNLFAEAMHWVWDRMSAGGTPKVEGEDQEVFMSLSGHGDENMDLGSRSAHEQGGHSNGTEPGGHGEGSGEEEARDIVGGNGGVGGSGGSGGGGGSDGGGSGGGGSDGGGGGSGGGGGGSDDDSENDSTGNDSEIESDSDEEALKAEEETAEGAETDGRITLLGHQQESADLDDPSEVTTSITTLRINADVATPRRSRRSARATAVLARIAPEGFIGHAEPYGGGGVSFAGCNAGGGLMPFTRSGHFIEGNRIEIMRDVTTEGIVDIFFTVEGKFTADDVPMATEYVRRNGEAVAIMAPSSTIVAGALRQGSSPSSGIITTMRPETYERVRLTERCMSGHLMHHMIGDGPSPDKDNIPLHAIAVYGLSGECGTTTLSASFATDLFNELDRILGDPSYKGHKFVVYTDQNSCRYDEDRVTGTRNACDKTQYALWRVFTKHGLRDLALENCDPMAAHPPMSYFLGGVPTSRIDVMYASANMGPARVGTGRALGELSATHVPIVVSFGAAEGGLPRRRQERRSRGFVDHAVAILSKGAGQKFSLSVASRARYQESFSVPAIAGLVVEAERLLEAGDQTAGLAKLEEACLAAQVLSRGNGGGSRAEAEAHGSRGPVEDIPDAAARVIRLLEPLGERTWSDEQREAVKKATQDLVRVLRSQEFEDFLEPPPDDASAGDFLHWAQEIYTYSTTRIMDGRGSFSFAGDWSRPKEGTAHQREQRKTTAVMQAVTQKSGGGAIDAIQHNDADGNPHLEARSQGIGETVQARQQENSHSRYAFTQVMVKILFNQNEVQAAPGRSVGERPVVASDAEVRERVHAALDVLGVAASGMSPPPRRRRLGRSKGARGCRHTARRFLLQDP